MKPCQVKTPKDILKLDPCYVGTKHSWIAINGLNEVVIANQRVDEAPTGEVRLTKKEMTKFAKWWLGLK